MGKQINRIAGFVLTATFLCACSPNQRIVESSKERTGNEQRPDSTPVKSSLEQDIEAMKTADFIFIYVFRRKDGQQLDADDKRFASNAIPGEMNRRSVSDEGKAIVIGSNFRMPPDNLKVLTERFAFEDHSRSDPAPNSNVEQQPNR